MMPALSASPAGPAPAIPVASSAPPASPSEPALAADAKTLVFHTVKVGMAPSLMVREEYILQHDTTHAILITRGWSSTGMIRLDGHELDPDRWEEPGETRWVGVVVSPGRYAFEHAGEHLDLSCKKETVDTLDPGAIFILGDACNGSRPPPRWSPPRKRRVPTFACEATGAFSQNMWLAPPPGIEYAHEHSDCAGQEGNFRRLK